MLPRPGFRQAIFQLGVGRGALKGETPPTPPHPEGEFFYPSWSQKVSCLLVTGKKKINIVLYPRFFEMGKE